MAHHPRTGSGHFHLYNTQYSGWNIANIHEDVLSIRYSASVFNAKIRLMQHLDQVLQSIGVSRRDGEQEKIPLDFQTDIRYIDRGLVVFALPSEFMKDSDGLLPH